LNQDHNILVFIYCPVSFFVELPRRTR